MLAESVDSDIEKRAFLAIPLYELAPDLVLPGLYRSIKDIAASLENNVMNRCRIDWAAEKGNRK